jgi:hypothetical protein
MVQATDPAEIALIRMLLSAAFTALIVPPDASDSPRQFTAGLLEHGVGNDEMWGGELMQAFLTVDQTPTGDEIA